MPIRVMSWNINRFSQATLDRQDYNEWYILEAITAQQLDIVLLIEVQSSGGLLGTLIGGNGAIGVRSLLASLRAEDPASDWRLVPPPRLNDNTLGQVYTEGLAVLYRHQMLTFTGPNYYQGPGTVATGVAPGVPYVGNWANALPAGNYRAPRINWTNGNGHPLEWPNAGNRPPMMVTFTENANGRNIRFLALHLPPDQARAATALPRINSIPQLLGGMAAADVAIAIGDINYDPSKNTTMIAQHYYDLFTNPYHFRGFRALNGVTRVEDTALAGLGLSLGGRRRYQVVRAVNGRLTVNHLDNAYIKYGAPPPPGTNYNPTVVDMVAGTGPYATTMALSIAGITGQPYYNVDDLFREAQNYGHVARYDGVSDHLPIVVDVP
ncbi:MAG: hypothetical protein ACJ74O_04955 [Frankiaceae bacterium]